VPPLTSKGRTIVPINGSVKVIVEDEALDTRAARASARGVILVKGGKMGVVTTKGIAPPSAARVR
jgi:hypothetical protein